MFSPLNAEIAALWIATDAHHCRGTKIIPLSMHNADEVLGDLDLNVNPRVRAAHWLGPVGPAAYRRLTPTRLKRLASIEPGDRDRPSVLPGAGISASGMS
ncbi:hypothetical protein OG226_48500 [Streptomyces sp. NBC_01261]|uniref:hypothetical protein n=1 Tax=Streptomyces sp. NBC_01261 TaxID=2903802 RepID=UPI002E2F4AB9|nr:hypothetical protein [Streptomyces sp. NBC_01261]